MSEIRFDDRVAIITGAGGGLGKTYAVELAKRGAKVVVDDLGGSTDGIGGSKSMADQCVKEIEEAGGTAVANYDSVATPEGGESIIQTALEKFGRIDIVINNAGILRDRSFAKLEPADLEIILDVHLKGAGKPTASMTWVAVAMRASSSAWHRAGPTRATPPASRRSLQGGSRSTSPATS